MSYPQEIVLSQFIAASAAHLWPFLCTERLLQQWMGDEELALQVKTTWRVGGDIIVSGTSNGHVFENNGIIEQCVENKILCYTSLSNLSNLPPSSENFERICFVINEAEQGVELRLSLSNFPTYEIYAHHNFYWPVALLQLKKLIEISIPH